MNAYVIIYFIGVVTVYFTITWIEEEMAPLNWIPALIWPLCAPFFCLYLLVKLAKRIFGYQIPQ